MNPLVYVIELSAGVFVVFLLVGRRQMHEGGGTRRRLIGVAAYAAALTCAPVLTWALVHSGDAEAIPPTVAIVWTGITLLTLALFVGPPLAWLRSKQPIPLVTDAAILARVSDIAVSLGIAPPRIRLRGSASGSLETQAFAGGLAAPSIVATDGILHRLDPNERDAILAHEMAHIATGSLWWLAAMPSVTGTVGVLIGAAMSDGAAMLASCVVWVGFSRIVSRKTEIVCDQAAGRAVGFATTANALEKLHVAIPFEAQGLVSDLAFATASHPSRAIRLAALRRAAPDSEKDTIAFDRRAAVRHRTLSVLAVIAWMATLTGTIVFGGKEKLWPLGHFVMAAVAATPLCLLLRARKRRVRDAANRMRRQLAPRSSRWRWIAVFALGLSIGMLRAAEELPESLTAVAAALLLMLAALVTLCVSIVSGLRIRRLRREVEEAIRDHEFTRALEVGRRCPKRVRRDPALRYTIALAKAAGGDRSSAVSDLEALSKDVPRMTMALAAEAALLIDVDPARSLAVASAALARTPDDPVLRVIGARAHRRLGHLDAAQAEIDRGRALDPEGGDLAAVAAGLALDRGDVAQARLLASEALSQAPGDATALVAHAEVAIAEGRKDPARAAALAAKEAAAASPLAFLDFEIRELEGKLAVLERT